MRGGDVIMGRGEAESDHFYISVHLESIRSRNDLEEVIRLRILKKGEGEA